MASRAPLIRRSSDPPRYGDFPHLFWDLAPDAPVDIQNEFVLVRLLIHGRPEDFRLTGALVEAAPRLAELSLPAHIRRFWLRLLDLEENG